VHLGRPLFGLHGILPEVERTRLRWRRLVVPTALVVVLAVAGGRLLLRDSRAAGTDAAAVAVGQPAPPLAGRTLSGGSLDLADLRGGVVVVSVWAAWCAPCREELPVLVAAERAHPGVRLMGIDTRDGERQARGLLAQVGGDPGSSVVDPDGTLAAAWEVAGVPETFVVDAGGTVRARHLGPVGEEWLDDAVAPLLREG
jgi:cytochrome c biogenesis protein CcmG, thiol:disulfide interchange protein DsbE